ncbi:CoA pyrophosphatase [Oceanicoccus sp. KOV_DT_Chl]|uniref:CoA pyrophosphatase n=1 Tax=Oceanicoccus sp. KOV_DT_Chl TaxID=1904639 RepID=UPI000C7DE531|nr:CoA pyrophosphatase [Oceanicoccus sp. KOV_DT_Chl]
MLGRIQQRLAAFEPRLYNSNYRQAAVLLAITAAEEPELILTRRARHLTLHPGEVAFPGGKRDPEDDSLWATALREANEEVGLLAADVTCVGALSQYLTRTNINISPFVAFVPDGLMLTPNLNELDAIFKTPLRHFLEPDNLQAAEKPYRGRLKKVPHFDYQQYGIWGVTALMIMDLMNTAFDAGLTIDN